MADFHVSDYMGEGVFDYEQRYLNLSGKANYTYDNRYVVELGFSYFGSDGYMPGNRWGFYPAISGAWVLSNEGFLKDQGAISFLKIRGGVGKSGEINSHAANQIGYASNGRYLYQQYYLWDRAFYSGISAPFASQNSLIAQFIANRNVFAETSTKLNAGFDVRFFDKLNITADVFVDKRSDILTKRNSQMAYYGANNYFENVGKMTNKGFELSATYTDETGNVSYSLQSMVFYSKNTIDYMDEVAPAFAYNAHTGKPYGTVIGLQSLGFYQQEDFETDGSLKHGMPLPLFGSVQPGDIRYKDLDGNGFIDQTDVTTIGNPSYPKWGYSFGAQVAYKGVDLSIMFQGAAGASVNLLNHATQFVAFVNNGNVYENALNAWAYYPEQGLDTRGTATYPKLTTQNNENNYRNSSFWMRDNNYLRLKNIEIGYNLTNYLIRTKGISTCRLFLNAVNPLTFSGLLNDYNMDPESGYGYPALTSYSVGINLTF